MAQHHVVGGISSAGRALPGDALLMARAAGPYLWDTEGRRYVDTALGFGGTILGHAPPAVVESVAKAVRDGPLPAFAHPAEEAAAACLARHTGPLERVVLNNSGSEAVHLACRIARAVTARSRVAKMAAGYDGWYDEQALGNAGSPEARPSLAPLTRAWAMTAASSGGPPSESFVLAVAEDRREFFCQYQQGGRFGQRLVLAVQLPLEFLDPAAVLPSLDRTGSPRLAKAGDRILLPGFQLRQIQAVLAAPGVAAGLVHGRRRDHRFQSRRRRPALATTSGPFGQRSGAPTLQRGHAHSHFSRDHVNRRTLPRQ